jgi:hypothetical protein
VTNSCPETLIIMFHEQFAKDMLHKLVSELKDWEKDLKWKKVNPSQVRVWTQRPGY